MIQVDVPCLGHSLEAVARFAGDDLWVLVTGGDSPHVGSVSVAVPRPSLSGDGTISATVSTYNVTGHKDGHVGELFARRLASEFNCIISATCGIHFEHAAPSDLQQILLDAEALLDILVAALRQ